MDYSVLQVVPLIRMRLNQLQEALPQLVELYAYHKRVVRGAPDFLAGYVMDWTFRYLQKEAAAPPKILPEHLNEAQQVRNLYLLQKQKKKVRDLLKKFQADINQYEEDYQRANLLGHRRNNYAGFRIPLGGGWEPTRLDHIPSQEEFDAYVQRREPFIISMPQLESQNERKTCSKSGTCLDKPASLGTNNTLEIFDEKFRSLSCPLFLENMGWGAVCAWNASYLCMAGGDEPVLLVTRSNVTDHFGITGEPKIRQSTSWCQHVQNVFRRNRTSSTAYFDFGSSSIGEDRHYFPLNRLRADLPVPSFLDPNLLARANKTQSRGSQRQLPRSQPKKLTFSVKMVSLWLGGGDNKTTTNCGLHYDAMDNFHALLQGHKVWTIFDPGDAPLLRYIAPVDFVLPDGTVHGRTSRGNLQFEKYVTTSKS